MKVRGSVFSYFNLNYFEVAATMLTFPSSVTADCCCVSSLNFFISIGRSELLLQKHRFRFAHSWDDCLPPRGKSGSPPVFETLSSDLLHSVCSCSGLPSLDTIFK